MKNRFLKITKKGFELFFFSRKITSLTKKKTLNQIPGCHSSGKEFGAGKAKQTLQQVNLMVD